MNGFSVMDHAHQCYHRLYQLRGKVLIGLRNARALLALPWEFSEGDMDLPK